MENKFMTKEEVINFLKKEEEKQRAQRASEPQNLEDTDSGPKRVSDSPKVSINSEEGAVAVGYVPRRPKDA